MNREFIGVGEASRILGLSMTSIQKLVDSGQIPAVKTSGGHRRLARRNVESINLKIGPKALLGLKATVIVRPDTSEKKQLQALTVLVVDDDAAITALIAGMFESFHPGVNLLLASDGLEALLLIEHSVPQILIVDLKMTPFDGFRLIELLNKRGGYESVVVVIITSMSEDEISQRGGLPQNALFLQKPLDLRRLRGFVDAHALMCTGTERIDLSPSKAVTLPEIAWPVLDK